MIYTVNSHMDRLEANKTFLLEALPHQMQAPIHKIHLMYSNNDYKSSIYKPLPT